MARFTLGGQSRRVGVVLFKDFHYRTKAGLIQQGGRTSDVMSTENHIDMVGSSHDLRSVLLRQATADGNLQPRMTLFERAEMSQSAVKPIVGIFSYAAGVEHHHIGLFDIVDRLHAFGHEQPRYLLRVVFVHLAPKSADMESTGHGHESTRRSDYALKS